MPKAPLHPYEKERIQFLHQLNILDTPAEPALDRIAQKLAQKLSTPIALISLVDEERQWFKSCLGLDVKQTPRNQSFCAFTILHKEPLVIADATKDPRTADNELVTGPPGIRAYAGYPLVVGGIPVGSLCAIDTRPRDFAAEEIAYLELLGQWAEREIELRDRSYLLQEKNHHLERASRLFTNAPVPLMVLSSDGTVLESNRAAQQFWEETLGDVENVVQDPRLPGRRIAKALQEVLQGRPPELDPLEIEGKDGPVFVRCSLESGLEWEGEPRVILGLEDITEYLWGLAGQAEAEQLDDGQDEFIFRLCHELRNPVNGIVGIIDLWRMGSERKASDLDTLESCALTLKGLVDDTLDFKRIAQGRVSIEKQEFDLKKFFRQVVASPRRETQKKNLDFRFRIHLDDNHGISDKLRLNQILSNLLSNAVKYTDEGRIELQVEFREGRLKMVVADTGMGISEELRDVLFEPYTQAKARDKDSKAGVGLGLSIVKQLLDRLDGTISLDSQVGQGTTFTVEMPVEASTGSKLNDLSLEIPKLEMTILVADDNPINRCILSAQLSGIGAKVLLATNGLEVLDILQKEEPDVILLDCHMPELDGYETVARIRADEETYGRPIVVALTASVREDAEKRCREAGMNHFLQKPVRLRELSSLLGALKSR